jgi:hypothetical protein
MSCESNSSSTSSSEDTDFQDVLEKFKDDSKMRWIEAKITNEPNCIVVWSLESNPESNSTLRSCPNTECDFLS